MQGSNNLFRPAALDAYQAKWLGEIVLVRPVSLRLLSLFAFTAAGLVVCFLIWGTYTKRSTVSGQLIPDVGLITIHVPQPGVVVHKHVMEGQQVRRGDVLYVLSSERRSSGDGNIEAAISKQVLARQRSLQEEREKTALLHQEEQGAQTKKIAGLQAELFKLESQIESQKNRVRLADETVARYKGLHSQDYISREQVQQKQEELLDQFSRLQSLERDRLGSSRELTFQANERPSLMLRQQNQLAQIDRNIATVAQELTENEAKRHVVVTAPQGGTATAIAAEVGQAIDSSKSLLSIVPAGAKMQAHLYASSKAIGFIKKGDPVLLRYQAYPYQKFGHAHATVSSISQTVLPGSELAGSGTPANRGAHGNNEPSYLITATLAAQAVHAYGEPHALQAGMLLEADVLQDKRRLYEWALEPLYSFSGRL